MRHQFWDYSYTKIDLDDLDVIVQLVHSGSLATVTVGFRVDPSALSGGVTDLKGRIEQIAGEILRSLAVSLDHPADPAL